MLDQSHDQFAILSRVHLLPLVAALYVTALSALPQEGTQPSSALTIVVIEGEDAVNVIQQRTAVAPVVEVRDKNGQPVSGAIVTFSVRSGRAAFNGARTLTVATNAAGRAAATGLTPTGAGALQIGASAAFEGQTAVATIVQTNVLTAAEAAGAAGAGSAGAGGGAGTGAGGAATGGGGGLSGTTIGIVGAAVAGGAAAAISAAGNDADESVTTSAPATTYTGTATMTVVDTAQSSGLQSVPGNSGGVCSFTRAVAITMNARLQENPQGVVTMGEFSTRWTETEISKSCPTTTTTGGTFPGSGPQVDDVSGQNVGSLHFERIDRGSPVAGATLAVTATFSGARSGDTIVGTFTLSRTQTGPGDARENRPATSTPITLRRQ